MQRQKTIAKWLGVILLATIVAGCYILAKSINENEGSSYIADGTGNNGDTPNEIDDKIPAEPYYSTFPRAAETISGVRAAHVGGEGDDVFLSASQIGKNTFIFFSSSSKEFDVKQPGLYLAHYLNGALIKTVRVASDAESFVFSKITYSGLLAATQTKTGTRLYLFSTKTSELEAETFIENAFAPYCHIIGKTAWIFCFEDAAMRAYRIGAGLALNKSAYLYPTGGQNAPEIVEIFPSKSETAITLQYELKTQFVSFSENGGFKLLNEYIKCRFMQINSISVNNEITYFSLMSHPSGFVLTAHNESMITKNQTVFGDTDFAVFFVKGYEIELILKNRALRLCRHLDLLEETKTDADFKAASNVIGYNKNMFLALNGSKRELYTYSQNSLTLLASFGDNDHNWFIWLSEEGINVCFSTPQNSGLCHMNFGGCDAFWLTFADGNEQA